MKIKEGQEEIYQKGLDNNTDPYGRYIYTYLKRWAELMEAKIEEEKDNLSVQEVMDKYHEQLSHEADTEGITGFMYGCAVSILSEIWEYGEELRIAHNREYGHTGDGVVNPAILTVETE